MAVILPYSTLRANYSPSTPSQPDYVSQADLYKEIGWDAFVGNPNYGNTCAVRMSLALLKSGHEVNPGSHRILAGAYKGKRLQVNMSKLADLLAEDRWFGRPETLSSPDVSAALAARRGIIAFHGIPGYAGGGHIDLIDTNSASLRCASACYFDADEVWFWPLSMAGV